MDTWHRFDDPWESSPSIAVVRDTTGSVLAGRTFQCGLEAGAGQGLLSPVWLEFCSSLHILDISPIALKKARYALRNQGERASFFNQDIHSFTPKTGYDLLIFSFVLDYLGFGGYPEKVIGSLAFIVERNPADRQSVLMLNPVYRDEDRLKIGTYERMFLQLGFSLRTSLLVSEAQRPFVLSFFEK